PDSFTDEEFIEYFTKNILKLNSKLRKTSRKEGIWDHYYPETDNNLHFALKKSEITGNRKIYFFTLFPDNSMVKEQVEKVHENLELYQKKELFHEEREKSSKWMGPGIVILVLLAEAFILLISRNNQIYKFGRASTATIPNLIMGIFFILMAVLVFIKKIKLTYLCLLITELATLINIVFNVVSHNRFSFFSWEIFGISLLHLFLLFFIPIRGKDFNIFSFRQFIVRVFGKKHHWL
nr:hypothetical protein [Deltaproteobacteria bacterium]